MATIEELLNTSLSEEFEQCGLEESTPEECEPTVCVPNDLALVPDWTAINTEGPYLNEKTCEYEVAIEKYDETTIQATSQAEIDDISEEIRTYGLKLMAAYYLKSATEGTDEFDSLLEATYVKDYEVSLARGRACADSSIASAFPTRALISIPAQNLDQATDIADESVSSTGSEFATNPSLSISAFDLQFKLIRLKNALRVYSKYQAIANNDPDVSTKIYYAGTKRILYIDEFRDYIDSFFPALQELVKTQGDYVMKPHRVFKGPKNLTETTFLFSDDGIINEVYFYSYGCEDKIKASAGFSKFLVDSYAQNKVISGFIGSIIAIDNAISAREPMAWYEFVAKYFNIEIDIIEGELEGEEASLGCFLETLELDTEIFDQLLNQIVSMPDIIAKKFDAYLCMTEGELPERNKLALKESLRNAIAESNASTDFNFNDPLWTNLGEILLKARNSDEFGVREIIDELTYCGLVALLLSLMECLGAQMNFEDMLKTAVKSALKNMKIAQLGNMWGLLPAGTQAQIYDIVIEKLTEEEYDVTHFTWPWSDEEEEEAYSNDLTRNTLTDQLTGIDRAITPILIDAMLEVVGANDLLEYLNTFPGAQIIAKILSESDCVEPPFGIDFPSFMKEGDIEFCRANYAITLPKIPELVFVTPLQGVVKALLAAARDALLEAFSNLIINLLSKLVYQLRSEICTLLVQLGSAAGAALDSDPSTSFLSALNSSLCGEESDSEDFNGNAFAALGSEATDEEAADFVNLIATIVTASELCDLLNGRPNVETVRIVFNIVQYNATNFLSVMPDERSVKSFFMALGQYVPRDELNKLCVGVENQFPANFSAGANACGDPQVYSDIQDFRRSLLECAELDADEVQKQMDGINARTSENFEQIMDVLQGQGVEGIIAQSFPSLSSAGSSTCPTSNGVFPKDDPVSYLSANDDIAESLEGIGKKFERDVVGRKGFFDYALCAADGTRLRRQNFINRFPLLNVASTIRADMGFNGDIEDNNYFPLTIGTPLQTSLSDYAADIKFDSSLNTVSIDFSFEGTDAFETSVKYRHSNYSDPDEDRFSLAVTETYDEEELLNEAKAP